MAFDEFDEANVEAVIAEGKEKFIPRMLPKSPKMPKTNWEKNLCRYLWVMSMQRATMIWLPLRFLTIERRTLSIFMSARMNPLLVWKNLISMMLLIDSDSNSQTGYLGYDIMFSLAKRNIYFYKETSWEESGTMTDAALMVNEAEFSVSIAALGWKTMPKQFLL